MRSFVKRFSYILLIVAVTLIIPTQAMAKDFKDVSSDYWANNDIMTMSDSGVLEGYDDGTFRPNQKVTREEFAKILVTSFGLDPLQSDSSFADVSSTRWSSAYIETAQPFMAYYTGPTGKKMFKPSEVAIREDVAVALVKALGLEPTPTNKNTINKFKDKNDISLQLRDYVSVAIESGLINGFEDSTFRGQDPITRAQTATLLNRIMKNAGSAQSLKLDVYKFESSVEDPNIIEFEGKVTLGSKITANNMKLNVGDDGVFLGTYRFRTSGTKNVVFIATGNLGKKISITKTININIPVPSILLDDISPIVNNRLLQINGTVVNVSKIKINENEVQISSDNWFSTQINLNKGMNVIKIEYRDLAEMASFKYLQVVYNPSTVTSSTYQ